MLKLFLLLSLSPHDITLWAEATVLYLTALAMACVSLATAALRLLHFIQPILEKWYPRVGAGEWRPKLWSILDKTTWTIQRISGAGHLPRQTSVRRVSQSAKESTL